MTPSRPSQQKVLVLHESFGNDARADEVDALLQVREVSDALQGLDFTVAVAEIGLDLDAGLRRLRDEKATVVFNLVESLGGRGELIGVVPALLRTVSMPFTGSGSEAITLSSQKVVAKRWLASHGIRTPAVFQGVANASVSPPPAYQVLAGGVRLREELAEVRSRWIVKSVWEHASFGLDDASVVRDEQAVEQRIEQCTQELGGQWFAERYIDGREFNVSLLELDGEPQVLPIAEMSFIDYPAGKPKIVGYAAKWDETASEYHATQRSYPALPKDLHDALESTARKCWALFGLRGYARVDVRVDERNAVWVLEVNANPCLARDAGFAAAGLKDGLSYSQIIERIVDAALRH